MLGEDFSCHTACSLGDGDGSNAVGEGEGGGFSKCWVFGCKFNQWGSLITQLQFEPHANTHMNRQNLKRPSEKRQSHGNKMRSENGSFDAVGDETNENTN